jgi:hypothetical protein
MDRERLGAWLEGYRRAWEEADTPGVLDLFAPDAHYRHRLAEAELGGDVLPREEVGRIASLQALDRSPNFSQLLRGEPGRLRRCRWFAHIGSLAPREHPLSACPQELHQQLAEALGGVDRDPVVGAVEAFVAPGAGDVPL